MSDDDRSDGEGSETKADVIDLAARARLKPDVGKLACRRLASARQRPGWTRAQLAAALDEMVTWTLSADRRRKPVRMSRSPWNFSGEPTT